MISIALPKGRLGKDIARLLGIESDNSRKLIFTIEGLNVRCMWVKPFDVPVYVEKGTADIGIAGKDVLLEREPDIYELMTMNAGKCRISIAAPENFNDDGENILKVATEMPKTAGEYFASIGRQVDIIALRGSTELAALTGLSDVIVDIVQTGETLRENGLHEAAVIAEISGRIIANKAAYKFKSEEIGEFIRKVKAIDKNNA